MNDRFKGIFAALTTPFIQEEVSIDKFKDNIQKLNNFDLAGYAVLGSTGEYVYLTDDESEKLVCASKETASPEKRIIVGTARESSRQTIAFTNRMAEIGIEAALIRTPGYYKSRLTRESLKKYYLTVADNTKIPIFIYNIPQYTGVTVDILLITELSKHPNIVGLKESSGNLIFVTELIPKVDSRFDILLGSGSLLLPGLSMGVSGGILTLGSVAPDLSTRLYSLYLEGKREEAQALQLKLVSLNQAITARFGIPGAKYALDLLGYNGGLPRLPLLPLEEKEKKEMRKILDDLGLRAKESEA